MKVLKENSIAGRTWSSANLKNDAGVTDRDVPLTV